MSDPGPIRVLFVCMGNICRSPMAQGLCELLTAEAGKGGVIACDSAGTHPYREGAPPHPEAMEVAAERGVVIARQRCRGVQRADFTRFDHLLAMDRFNLDALRYMSPRTQRHKVELLLRYAGADAPEEVPDPMGGARGDYERALALIEVGVRGLLAELGVRGPPGGRNGGRMPG